MRVRVKLMRNAGHWLTWNQKPREYAGNLLSGRASSKGDEQGVNYIFIDGEGPKLYDPKVKSVLDNEFRFVGLEKHESAWVLQEWNCEVL